MKRPPRHYRPNPTLPKSQQGNRATTPFRPKPGKLYIAFHKPFDVVSQFTPPHNGARTLSEFGFPTEVYPVGRLDQDSEGLLLLTDDAALNHALLHPSRQHTKTYLVQVEGIPDDEALRRLAEGVVVQGKLTLPATAIRIPPPPLEHREIRYRAAIPTSWLRLTLAEGRNRQVRRMTAAVGFPTLRLFRESIGTLSLLDLQLSATEWRVLSPEELRGCLLSASHFSANR